MISLSIMILIKSLTLSSTNTNRKTLNNIHTTHRTTELSTTSESYKNTIIKLINGSEESRLLLNKETGLYKYLNRGVESFDSMNLTDKQLAINNIQILKLLLDVHNIISSIEPYYEYCSAVGIETTNINEIHNILKIFVAEYSRVNIIHMTQGLDDFLRQAAEDKVIKFRYISTLDTYISHWIKKNRNFHDLLKILKQVAMLISRILNEVFIAHQKLIQVKNLTIQEKQESQATDMPKFKFDACNIQFLENPIQQHSYKELYEFLDNFIAYYNNYALFKELIKMKLSTEHYTLIEVMRKIIDKGYTKNMPILLKKIDLFIREQSDNLKNTAEKSVYFSSDSKDYNKTHSNKIIIDDNIRENALYNKLQSEEEISRNLDSIKTTFDALDIKLNSTVTDLQFVLKKENDALAILKKCLAHPMDSTYSIFKKYFNKSGDPKTAIICCLIKLCTIELLF